MEKSNGKGKNKGQKRVLGQIWRADGRFRLFLWRLSDSADRNEPSELNHTGTRNPTREELEIIAETLEVSVNWLLYGGEYPELNWDDPALSRPTLLEFRKSHGLTQKALAAEMGVSPSKISKWENTEADQSVIDFIKERYGVEINKC